MQAKPIHTRPLHLRMEPRSGTADLGALSHLESRVRNITLLVLALACAAASGQPVSCFVRFTDDGHGGGQMQAAVATYRNDETGVTVDLLSTMHIGDGPFFRQMAKRLNGYDAVLYELVAHRGEPATEEGVNAQQARIASDMDLENQGPHMDYDRPTFVHADLDLEDIERQEVAAHGTFKGALGDGPGLASATGTVDTAGLRSVYNDLVAAKSVIQSNPREHTRLMRRAYSRLLAFTAEPAPGKTYPADMEVLVGARNAHVMDVLAQQVGDAGKRHIGILFGAAHMVDLEHRLLTHGYERTSLTWVTAWTVAPDGTPTTRPARKPNAR